jgi:hypothetical protein
VGQESRLFPFVSPGSRNAKIGLSFPSSHTRVKPHAASPGSDGYRSMRPDLKDMLRFTTSGISSAKCPRPLVLGIAKNLNPEMPKYVTLSHGQRYSSLCFQVFMFWDFAILATTTPCPFELPVSEIPKYRTPKRRSSTPNWDQRLIASPDPMACVFLDFMGQEF